MKSPLDFVSEIAATLERLGIPCHVGGSLASSAHGMYRASADVDLVIDPSSEQLAALLRALEPEFYVSDSAAREALASHGTFNAIHSETSLKIDFFMKGPSRFDAEEFRRSEPQFLGEGGTQPILFKSAEDTILRKLEWYPRGGEASERHWHDVRSILLAGAGTLDDAHLDRWAREIGVFDLLERARREAAES